MIVLVLGGARSGKSDIAEHLAGHCPQPVTYIATGSTRDANGEIDLDMAERVEQHRQRRPPTWVTHEAGANLIDAVRSTTGTVLIDALGTWLAAHHSFDIGAGVDLDALCTALATHVGDVIVVSDEVGLGVHPSSETGRRFRDALGLVNRAVADVADRVVLVVAGRVMELGRP